MFSCHLPLRKLQSSKDVESTVRALAPDGLTALAAELISKTLGQTKLGFRDLEKNMRESEDTCLLSVPGCLWATAIIIIGYFE